MIVHVVCFKLKDPTPENVEIARKKLLSLEGNVPQVRHLEVGADELHSPRSYDLVLITHFDSWEDSEAYQVHPFHKEVGGYLSSNSSSLIAVDYER